MEKRFIISGVILGLLCVLLLLTGWFVASKQGARFVSPRGEREWARKGYEEIFFLPLQSFPTLASTGVKEPISIEADHEAGNVRLNWTSPGDYYSLEDFGQRVPSDPAKAEAVLPNGQKVTLVGIAISKPVPGGDYEDTKISWHDPVSLEAIAKPGRRGLESWRSLDRGEQKLILAFRCSDTERKPVRWHFVRARNAETLTRMTSGGNWGVDNGIMYYTVGLDLYHDAPIDISLPICFGEPEPLAVSLQENNDDKPARFASEAAEASILFSTNGDQNSSSSSRDGRKEKVEYRWKILDDGKSRYRQRAFSILRTWPESQAFTLEWRMPHEDPKKQSSWSSVHGREGIFDLGFRFPLGEVEGIELRRYPHLAHCRFQLQGVPGLPRVNNLFEVESGPIRFRYASDVFDFIGRATATKWKFHRSSIWDHEEFPLEFENLTPAEVLEEIESRSGEEFFVNRKTHTIEGKPPAGTLRRFMEWIEKTFSP